MLTKNKAIPMCLALGIAALSACTSHQIEVKPVEIKPIHITIDVNVKIDKDLNDFFNDIDNSEEN